MFKHFTRWFYTVAYITLICANLSFMIAQDVIVTHYAGPDITEDNSSGVYNETKWYYEMLGDTILIKATFSYFEGMWSNNLRMLPRDNFLPEFISFSQSGIGSNGGGGGPSLNYDPMYEGEIQIQSWGENGNFSGKIVRSFEADIPFWTDTELPVISCTQMGDCPEYFYCKSDYEDCSTADNTGTCVLFHYGECGNSNNPVCTCSGYTLTNECWADINFSNIAYSGECSEDCTIPGDVNNDGVLDVLDIVRIVNSILGPYSEDYFACGWGSADVNDDGTVNILDIVMMVNIILGND
ncbi:MAG: hypothetical protein H8E72_02195 [Candidatus Marinimicrobia bacterium]|nr:hypothetical protein [Candidatus Neomarinimicrobiota bacterium]